jgi:iron complex outermembrane receptor protein
VNPKAGLTYAKNGWQTYLSYALGQKEPNRDDFEASLTNQPKKEMMHDFEAGIEKKTSRFQAAPTSITCCTKTSWCLPG